MAACASAKVSYSTKPYPYQRKAQKQIELIAWCQPSENQFVGPDLNANS